MAPASVGCAPERAGLVKDRSVVYVQIAGSRHTPAGYVSSTYTADEIDAIAAYCDELDCCYLLPVELVSEKHSIHLRLSTPKNGQRAGLNWAADHSFDGAIAQWEERCRGTAEVAGSSPASSTQIEGKPEGRDVGAHVFRNHFGYYMERAAAGEEILITRRGKLHARLGPPHDSPQGSLELAA